jgi:phosphoglycolate phosphatase
VSVTRAARSGQTLETSEKIRRMKAFASPIRAIAIDLDGTLLDTIPDLCGAVNLVLADLNFASLPIEVVRTFVGKGLGEHMRKSLHTAMGREPNEVEKAHAMDLYRAHYAAHIADPRRFTLALSKGLTRSSRSAYPCRW